MRRLIWVYTVWKGLSVTNLRVITVKTWSNLSKVVGKIASVEEENPASDIDEYSVLTFLNMFS